MNPNMMPNSEGKIIVIDYGAIMFSAIFSQKFTPTPLAYGITNILLANLLKIGVDPEDDIIIAVDKGKSWRKMYEPGYKADRKEKREKHTEIDWTAMFEQSNKLQEQLEYSTNWTFLYSEGLEADDWASYIPRYYKDREVVLISFDSDWEQMLVLPNVTLFSPKTKRYKFSDNPYAGLAKKINKETADNLVNPILTEKDFERRNICVNLFELPDFVEAIMKEKLDTLDFMSNEEHVECFPFQKSLLPKYLNLYNDKSKIISIEKSLKQIERKKKKMAKKSKLKREEKKCLKNPI